MDAAAKRNVVIGLIGPMLDAGQGPQRWERWRPTVALCQHADLLVHRFELLYELKFKRLMEQICEDIRAVSPETEIRPRLIGLSNAWDFQDVYGALHDYCKTCPFSPDEEEYFVHITTGTHVAQI